MPDFSGYWKLDAVDLWSGYHTLILNGTTDFLKYAPKKESTEYSWPDQHGLDVDLTTPKFQARTITLNCAIICDDRTVFNDNYTALITQLMLPGFHSITVNAHGPKTYSVEYRECNNYKPVWPLTVDGTSYNVHQFTLIVRELEPNPGAVTLRLVDESGRYIVS
jgi:hypothetical protein